MLRIKITINALAVEMIIIVMIIIVLAIDKAVTTTSNIIIITQIVCYNKYVTIHI